MFIEKSCFVIRHILNSFVVYKNLLFSDGSVQQFVVGQFSTFQAAIDFINLQ